MTIKEIISQAGRNNHTIILIAEEKDGSVETREAEPYSYRNKGGNELFYCYDISKGGLRSFNVSKIISVKETDHAFSPRWPVEV